MKTKAADLLSVIPTNFVAIPQSELNKVARSVTFDKALRHHVKKAEASKIGAELFWYLRMDEERKLSDPRLVEALNAAIKRDDLSFLAEVVRLFSLPTITWAETIEKFTPLERYLLQNWYRPGEPLQYSLCFYSEPALLKYIRFLKKEAGHKRFPDLYPELLLATWTRLGLKKKPLLFCNVRIERGKVLPIPLKKVKFIQDPSSQPV